MLAGAYRTFSTAIVPACNDNPPEFIGSAGSMESNSVCAPRDGCTGSASGQRQ
jgi:hypothetical protein